MKKTSLVLLLACLTVLSTGCQQESRTQGSNLTPGMAKTKITNGVTTQTEILEVFGAPNIITKNKSGNEVWSYDRVAMDKSNKEGYWTILAAGASSGNQTTSTKTFTLMLEFDDDGTVKDNSYRASQF
jgi:hypothetical protein